MSPGFARRAGAVLVRLLVIALVGGFVAAALVRYSPGFDIDENDWSLRIGDDLREARRQRHAMRDSLPVFYARYLSEAVHGNFGTSKTFGAPVADLLRERAPVSLALIAWGVGGGLLLGLSLAWTAVWHTGKAARIATSSLSGFLIAIPPAVLALFFFFERAPLGAAVALAVFPRIFGTLRAVMADLYVSPALLAARARGLSGGRIAWQYVLAPALPHLAAIAGIAVAISLGTIIPVESLCDVAGIGQLAWKAALARDLPLLSAMALIITFAISAVYAVGELLQ